MPSWHLSVAQAVSGDARICRGGPFFCAQWFQRFGQPVSSAWSRGPSRSNAQRMLNSMNMPAGISSRRRCNARKFCRRPQAGPHCNPFIGGLGAAATSVFHMICTRLISSMLASPRPPAAVLCPGVDRACGSCARPRDACASRALLLLPAAAWQQQ